MNKMESIDIMNEFYSEILSITDNIKLFPIEIKHLLYDPRFNYPVDVNSPEGCIFNDIEMYYRPLFAAIDDICKYAGTTYPVCDSSDVHDEIECGDYDYIIGRINDECSFLYQLPSHQFACPYRIIIYSPRYQIEIDSSIEVISVYETNQYVRNMFYLPTLRERVNAIKNMLIHSDRPLLI